MKSLYLLITFITIANASNCCLAFSQTTPTTQRKTPADIFQSVALLFLNQQQKPGDVENKIKQQKRDALKTELLALFKQENKVDRSQVEAIIEELKTVQSFAKTATSPLLQKEWLLVWTTEKEINVFSDWNISGDITQTITDNTLKNWIPFRSGGGFGVTGTIEPDKEIVNRTNFVFSSATIDFGLFKVSIPPIGKGWFDTVYLDDNLRVDVNVRNDILICVPHMTKS